MENQRLMNLGYVKFTSVHGCVGRGNMYSVCIGSSASQESHGDVDATPSRPSKKPGHQTKSKVLQWLQYLRIRIRPRS